MSQPPPTVHGQPTGAHARVDQAPARIGRFVVLRQLGAGAMGVVYSAYDEDLDRRVAIKLLRAGVHSEPGGVAQARLVREAQAMARVAHPNIAAIYEVGVLGEQVYVAMELVHGQTLREWAAGPRRWREVLALYCQAARGLQAAHERGIIHRDFKPDNVLIGDDGRVRVLDFSLARSASADDDDDPAAPAGAVAPGNTSLTLAGKIVGTPAYMSPEQALGVAIDPRADQFSFCVALFEALFGRRPFAGAALSDIIEDILRERVVFPPEPPLPAWLTRALLRGLRPSPEQRWPAMTDLLAEIERDRTRWLRVASALALAGALAGLALLALQLRERWQRAGVEQAAAERLTVLEGSLDRALAEGRRDEAAAALAAFTDAPEHRDTPAVAAAYLGWSRRMQAAQDLDAARLAAARAYAVAGDEPGTEAALEQLAGLFRAQGAWHSAALLIADVRANLPALLERPAWALTAAHAARRRRDFADFADLAAAASAPPELSDLAPVLASLSHGTASTWTAVRALPIADEGTIGLFGKDIAQEMQVVRADPSLSAVGTISLPGWDISGVASRLRPGDPTLMLAHRAAPGEITVQALTPAGPRELLRLPGGPPLGAVVTDLDGDGTPTLYLGTGPYDRKLLALTPDPAGALHLDHPHPGTDAAHSDLLDLLTADLDGDGRDELVLAAGPWNAYDLRVFRPGAAPPELTLIARRKFGVIPAIAALPGVDGRTRVLAAKIDLYPSRVMFPPEHQTGEPAGLYVLELRDDQLDVVAHHPWPSAPGGVRGTSMLAVGDIDGDGRADAVVTLTAGDQGFPFVVVFRQLAAGTLAPIDIAGLKGLMLGQFDDDPAVELLARVYVDEPGAADPAGPLWVLGAGTTPVPPLPLARPEPASVPADADPLVARAWRRAEQLASLGLVVEAARTIADLTNISESPAVAASARRRAADLFRGADQCDPAIDLYEQVRAEHPVAALQGLTACFEREGRFSEALASADRLLARGDLDPALRAATRERAERLRPGSDAPPLDLSLGPLAPGWQFPDPSAVRQDLGSGLVIDAIVNHDELARLPLRCDGERLSLRAELQVEHSEWGSGLELAVRDAGATTDTVGLVVTTDGGGGVFNRVITCRGPDGDHTLEILRDTPAAAATTYTFEVDYRPALERLICTLTSHDGVRRSHSFAAPPGRPPAACDLTLRARPIAFESTLWTHARLTSLRLGGATLAPATADPRDPTRLLVEGDALAALAHLEADADPLRAVWRAMALEELGHWQEAGRVLAAAELTPGSPARRALLGLLRTRAASFGVLTRDALGDDAFRAHAEAFLAALHSHPEDTWVRRTLGAAISDPSEFHPEAGDRDGLLLRANFNLFRANMWIAAGALERGAAALAAGIADLPALGVIGPTEILRSIRPAMLAPTLAAARGDREGARALVREALAHEAAPEIVLDLLRLHPLLRPLLDDL